MIKDSRVEQYRTVELKERRMDGSEEKGTNNDKDKAHDG